MSKYRSFFIAKGHLILIFITLLCSVDCSGNGNQNDTNILDNEPTTILTLGDSITQGNQDHKSYRYNLWKKLIAAGEDFDFIGSLNTNYNGNPVFPPYMGMEFDPDHEGHWGWTADRILANLPDWLQSYTPDIVLIHIGTNDMFQGQNVIDTGAEIESIIDTLRNDNPKVTIYLAKLIPSNNANDDINALNEEIIDIVAMKDSVDSAVILVDQNSGFDIISDTYDGIHPNEDGEEKMAQKWFDIL